MYLTIVMNISMNGHVSDERVTVPWGVSVTAGNSCQMRPARRSTPIMSRCELTDLANGRSWTQRRQPLHGSKPLTINTSILRSCRGLSERVSIRRIIHNDPKICFLNTHPGYTYSESWLESLTSGSLYKFGKGTFRMCKTKPFVICGAG